MGNNRKVVFSTFYPGMLGPEYCYDEKFIVTPHYISYEKKYLSNAMYKENQTREIEFSLNECRADMKWIIRVPSSAFDTFLEETICYLLGHKFPEPKILLDVGGAICCGITDTNVKKSFGIGDCPEWEELKSKITEFISQLDAPVPDFFKNDEFKDDGNEDDDVNV